MELKN
jgi:hypothetical protein